MTTTNKKPRISSTKTKKEIKQLIDECFNSIHLNDPHRARQLSMPLMASAQLGDRDLFEKIFNTMLDALDPNTMPDHWLPWIYGRVLFALSNAGIDKVYIQATRTKIKNLLHTKTNVHAKKDEFAAWAWGYLAGMSANEYGRVKKTMKKSSDTLNVRYFEEKTESALSNALWAWILVVFAAAQAKDEFMYHYALAQIKTLTEQTHISAALQQGLQRRTTSNDYPAWGMALVQLAAALHQDHALFNELNEHIQEVIEDAELSETMLAKVNHALAKEIIRVPSNNSAAGGASAVVMVNQCGI